MLILRDTTQGEQVIDELGVPRGLSIGSVPRGRSKPGGQKGTRGGGSSDNVLKPLESTKPKFNMNGQNSDLFEHFNIRKSNVMFVFGLGTPLAKK